MKTLKKEIDQLTTVWIEEQEKTTEMNKLMTALFSEVTDVADQAAKVEDIQMNLNLEHKESVA